MRLVSMTGYIGLFAFLLGCSGCATPPDGMEDTPYTYYGNSDLVPPFNWDPLGDDWRSEKDQTRRQYFEEERRELKRREMQSQAAKMEREWKIYEQLKNVPLDSGLRSSTNKPFGPSENRNE